jgi:fatty-acyl-CoA synthase
VLDDRQLGEIVIRTSSLMDGYREAETATREALRDGWLWTGDLGYLARRQGAGTGRTFLCGLTATHAPVTVFGPRLLFGR